MATLGKKAVIIYLVICCVLFSAQAVKWRVIAKTIRRCDGPEKTIELRNLTLTYSNKGEFFHIHTVIDVARNVSPDKVGLTAYNLWGSKPIKYLYWEFKDLCADMMKGHPFIDPIFESGEFPKDCKFIMGKYPVKSINYDLHGVTFGTTYRGNYIIMAHGYSGESSVFCVNVYVLVKRDSLN